jgi:hypothetical protein
MGSKNGGERMGLTVSSVEKYFNANLFFLQEGQIFKILHAKSVGATGVSLNTILHD